MKEDQTRKDHAHDVLLTCQCIAMLVRDSLYTRYFKEGNFCMSKLRHHSRGMICLAVQEAGEKQGLDVHCSSFLFVLFVFSKQIMYRGNIFDYFLNKLYILITF